jgi:hypothetical protein
MSLDEEGTSVFKLKAQISELNLKIAKIQEECSHPQYCLDVKHRSSTGNYDPSQDCYWTEYHCQLCDKHWSESSE